MTEKLRLIHQQFNDCIDDFESRLAKEESQNQAKDGKLALLHQEKDDLEKKLAAAQLDQDAYARQIAWPIMDAATDGRQNSPVPVVCK